MSATRRSLERRTLTTLFVGYAGYYLCRSNYSIAGLLMKEELGTAGFGEAEFGMVASIGVVCYAVGKVCNGLLADKVGGRRCFLIGMFGSVLMTCCFGMASGFAAFALFWGLNRWFQSMGWAALVKVAAAWFPPWRIATVMGLLSGSYLIGDALARGGLSLALGLGWRGVFFVAAVGLLSIAVLASVVLVDKPEDLGLPSEAPGGEDLYQTEQGPLSEVLPALLSNPAFWMVCGLNFGLTLLREAFNTWCPQILHDNTDLGTRASAAASMIFPIAGGLAALTAGRLVDRLGWSPARMCLPFLSLMVLCLVLLASLDLRQHTVWTVALVAGAAFFLIGPYSFLSGVMAIELGGKAGAASVVGLVDGAGYLGAIASGYGVGLLAEESGWSAALGSLAAVGVGSLGLAWWQNRIQATRRPNPPRSSP